MADYDKDVKIRFTAEDNASKTIADLNKKTHDFAKGVKSTAAGVLPPSISSKKKQQDTQRRRDFKEAQRFDAQHLNNLTKELSLQKKITEERKKQAKDKAESSKPKEGFLARLSPKLFGDSGLLGGKGGGVGAGLKSGAALGVGISAGMSIANLLTSMIAKTVGFMKSQITSGYTSYLHYGRARAGIAGMGDPSAAVLRQGERSGYSDTDTVQQMRGMGRATGQLAPTIKAQQISRSYGGTVDEVTEFFGTLTRAGQGFGGKAGQGGNLQMRRILSDAFKSGLDRSRAGEVLQSVASGVKAAQSATAGAVDASRISALLSFFSRSGKSGLQGARGAAVMGALDSTIKGAGRLSAGADVTKTLLLQSQGFGVPGGNTSYLGATRNLEQGVFGTGGAKNLVKMVDRIRGMGGDREMQAAQLSALTGGTLNQSVSGSVLDTINAGGGSNKVLASIEAITKEQKPINEQLLDTSKESLKVAQRVAHLDNRLLDIGKQSSASIEKMQDAMLHVADILMPAAQAVLLRVAVGVERVAGIVDKISKWVNSDEAAETVEGVTRAVDQGVLPVVRAIPGGSAVDNIWALGQELGQELQWDSSGVQRPPPPPPRRRDTLASQARSQEQRLAQSNAPQQQSQAPDPRYAPDPTENSNAPLSSQPAVQQQMDQTAVIDTVSHRSAGAAMQPTTSPTPRVH